MIKTVEYNLEYREKGEKKYKTFTIDFISNGVIKRYDKLINEINEFSKQNDERQNLLLEIVGLRSDKPEMYKELIKAKKERVDEIEKFMQGYTSNGHFERRFEILKTILQDNGVTEEKFMTFDFWENCVDANSMIELMTNAIWKDLQSDKKKVQEIA